MIRIQELPALKVPGRTSLFCSFHFNHEVINRIKELPLAVYHKKQSFWEIPLYLLPELLDKLTFLDEIELISYQAETLPTSEDTKPLTDQELANFKLKPFQHQVEGINFLLKNKKSLLLDAPGLGKTSQVIYYAEILKERGFIDHCLIICGINSLKSNWCREIQKFSNLDCIIIGEKKKKSGEISPIPMSMKDRIQQLKNPISEFFVIINIESIRSEEVVEAINHSPNKFGLIVVDECHKCSNFSSDQGHSLVKLKSDYQVGLTGTIITNNVLNCYLPMRWIDVDHSTLTNFKSAFCKFGGYGGYQVIGYQNLDFLKEELESCSLRRTKEVAKDLPPKVIDIELLDMEEDHAKFYEAIKQGVKEEADKIELNSGNLLALTTRLRQATADPAILTTNPVTATKLERCYELVEELVEQGEKVVVMSIFKDPIYKLEKLLVKFKPLVNTGDIPDLTVSQNIEKFQTDSESKVFLATAAKCGTGITLNSASHMICIDIPWTDALFQQMTDRIHRLDNKSSAFVTVLVCRGTIDQRVLDIVESKKQISDFVVDNVQNELANSLKAEMTKIIREL